MLQVRFGEQCDDGNAVAGDLCDPFCKPETPVPPRSTGSPPRGSVPPIPGATPGVIPSEIPTKVVLRGKAYPNSTVSILVDGKLIGSTLADSNADFQYTTSGITPGTVTFGFLAKDQKGTDSIMNSVVFEVIQSAVTTVANIFIPPTIRVDRAQIPPGGLLMISGQTVPSSLVNTAIRPDASSTITSIADLSGNWALQIDTGSLADGAHSAKAYFQQSATVKSGYGKSVNFFVGIGQVQGGLTADLNHDGKVNLVDFSIFLISWNTSETKTDFNTDGNTNLADFSIMLFQWTG